MLACSSNCCRPGTCLRCACLATKVHQHLQTRYSVVPTPSHQSDCSFSWTSAFIPGAHRVNESWTIKAKQRAPWPGLMTSGPAHVRAPLKRIDQARPSQRHPLATAPWTAPSLSSARNPHPPSSNYPVAAPCSLPHNQFSASSAPIQHTFCRSRRCLATASPHCLLQIPDP
jgi:hypothetical protein